MSKEEDDATLSWQDSCFFEKSGPFLCKAVVGQSSSGEHFLAIRRHPIRAHTKRTDVALHTPAAGSYGYIM
jgi:hypothetical protein